MDEWAQRVTRFEMEYPEVDAIRGELKPPISVTELEGKVFILAERGVPVVEVKRAFGQVHPKRRRHERALALRLQVYDLVNESGSFIKTAQRLAKPESTVRSAWLAACRDIGTAPASG